LKEKNLYLTGESYAGKYLPMFTHALLQYVSNNTANLSLSGTLIIDPYTAPIIQRTHMHVVPEAQGVLTSGNMD